MNPFICVNTIIKLAVSFGKMLRVNNNDLFYALLITQLVGVLFTLAFGWLAKRVGAKKGILVGLVGYTLICIGAAFMQKGAAWQFYALAISVGMVQGGVQALSRSLFASMVPKENSAELFGFYSTMAKFASLLGPAVLWLV